MTLYKNVNGTRIAMTPEEEAAFEASRAPEPVTTQQVNAERDRRIYSSMPYAPLGVAFQTDESSMESITGAATLAGFALGAGAQPGDYFWHGGADPFSWIVMDNSIIQIDAPTMFAIGQAAMAWKSAHIFAARTLKDMNPIPHDYADDKWWPA